MKAWQRILLGYGLLAVALGLLTALVGLMVTGLRLDQPRDVLVVVVVFNLMLAALFGGIALLDSRRWPSWPSRRIAGASIQPMPTLAGWLVLGATANCIAGISVFFGGTGRPSGGAPPSWESASACRSSCSARWCSGCAACRCGGSNPDGGLRGIRDQFDGRGCLAMPPEFIDDGRGEKRLLREEAAAES